MASRTVTLALDGEVSLRHFVDAMRHFRGLIDALSNEVARNVPIEWIVQDLEFSSTIATARGESDAPEYVERVTSAFLTTGKAMQGNQPVGYSDKVLREARGITSVLNGKINSVRFETSDDDATIYSRSEGQTRPTMLKAYGAVEGRIQTLTERGSLRFTLYDTLNDKAVSCYLTEDQQELMRGVWGRRAIVQGRVSRDPLSGRPVAIRNISNVEIMEDVPPGTYRQARGVVSIEAGAPSAAEAIRRVRDAW